MVYESTDLNRSALVADRLRSLVEVCVALTEKVDPDEVLEHLLEVGQRLLQCEGVSLALLDEARDELVFATMAGLAKTASFRIPADHGIAGEVLRRAEPVLQNDVRQDERFFRGVDDHTGYETRSVCCAPVKQRGRVVGVMTGLNSIRATGFTTNDQEVLGAFAALAGAALTRAHLAAASAPAGRLLRDDDPERYQLESRNQAMAQVLATVRRAAGASTTVLLLGESGTGKEVLARELHRKSPRADRPFVAVNCVALSPTLLESELFGHEKGAFTGAAATKKGRFELADGGTLFLDEIGDISPELQAKLLRVIQEREVERVGGARPIPLDVRLIAATNRDLEAAVKAGEFREDLYYRLNVVAVRVPPLRERPEDVPSLAEHLLRRACATVKRPRLALSPEARSLLERYAWPGNVRELGNVLERAAVLCPDDVILPDDLPPEVAAAPLAGAAPVSEGAAASEPGASDGAWDGTWDGASLAEAVERYKRQRIEQALAVAEGNQTRAAELLGIHQSNLSRLMKRLGLR
ncbi:MAG: sigma 54-interacting transcriptional regulator [Planctomycetota bacterium]